MDESTISQAYARGPYVLFCGQSIYPRTDTATANRYTAIARITHRLGYDVAFLNRHPVFDRAEQVVVESEFLRLDASGSVRSGCWLFRQLSRALSIFREFRCIRRFSKGGSIEYINVYTQYALDLVFYYMVAKNIRAECVVHIVEHRSQFERRKPLLRLNDFVFEAIAPRLFSRFVVIGGATKALVTRINPQARVSVVFPVCDYGMICSIPAVVPGRPYFLYCASMAYEDVAWFVIESYLAADIADMDLILILGGQLSGRIISAVSSSGGRISVFSALNYVELIGLYKGAVALLIPLRDCEQDRARFSHKISEYLASRRPIITTNIGEVRNHFTDGVDAIVCAAYDVAEYAEKMRFASAHRFGQLEEIAAAGHQVGWLLFDEVAQSERLKVALSC